jgi:hypothetical protein
MKETLLLVGGAVNLLFGLFHVWLATAIQSSKSLSAPDRALMHMLSVAVTCFILFFAYVSFFHRGALLSTELGTAMLVLVALIYLSRAVEEIVFRNAMDFSVMIFVPCLVMGGIYLSLFL